MGKKKWTGHGERRKHNKNTHKKGRGHHPQKNLNNGGRNRNQKPNESEIQQSNSIEAFHSRMTKCNLMEKDIGVTEYVGNTPGFNAVIKSRFSDFQVNEIDLDGHVVKLTDTSLPPRPQSPSG